MKLPSSILAGVQYAKALFEGSGRWWLGGPSPYEATKQSQFYPTDDNFNFDQDQMLDLASLDTLRSAARSIYGSFSPVAGAIHDKATTAVGQHWIPIYYGDNHKWGVQATNWLKEYFKILDVRGGGTFDFLRNQYIGSVTLDREGEYFIIPIVNPATGWVSFQWLEAHTCGSRFGVDTYSERFPGLVFLNGVWRNPFGRPVAYNFIGPTPELDRVIPADRVIHVYDPKWFSQGRGVASIVQGLLDWKDIKRFRDNEKTASNVFSALTLVERNATGKPDLTKGYFTQRTASAQPVATDADGSVTATAAKKLVIEEHLRGAIRYIRAGTKNGIEAFTAGNRPPEQVIKFQESIMRGAFSGMDWPIEHAYSWQGAGTAEARAITNKCQRSVQQRQRVLLYPAMRVIQTALAVASSNGFIPAAPVDWYKWGFALPPKMTNDQYREAQQDREDYKIGFITLREIYANRGEWWVDHIDQRFVEEVYLDDASERFDIDVARVRMLTPNGNPVEQDAATAQEEDDKSKGRAQATRR
jgi:hypothetical protein